MYRLLALTAVLAPCLAQAADTEITWQGRLLDANGAPISGERDLTLSLERVGGAVLWEKTYSGETVSDGYVSVVLGGFDDNEPARDLDPAWFLDETYVAVAVNGTLMGAAQRLTTSPRAASVVGGVQLAGDPVCDSDATGALRWSGASVQACNGTTWTAIGGGASGQATGDGSSNTNPGHSCKSIHDSTGAAANQSYWIDPDGAGGHPAFRVHCDMANGGWTQVLRLFGGAIQLNGTGREGFWALGATLNTSWAYGPFTQLEATDQGFVGWDRLSGMLGGTLAVRAVGTNELGTSVDETYVLRGVDMKPFDGRTDFGGMGTTGRWAASVHGDPDTRSDWGACGITTAANSHVGLGLCPSGFISATPSDTTVQLWHYGSFAQCFNISLGEPGSGGNYTYTCNRGNANVTLYFREQ